MEGLLAEHGPFLLADDGKTLKANRYAWNKVHYRPYTYFYYANSLLVVKRFNN